MKHGHGFPLFLIALLAVLTSCGGKSRAVSHTVVGTARPAISWKEVRVYGVIPPDAIAIADIHATSAGWLNFTDARRLVAVVERMKRTAAEYGANGIWLADDMVRSETVTATVVHSALGFVPKNSKIAPSMVKFFTRDGKDYEFNAKAFYTQTNAP